MLQTSPIRTAHGITCRYKLFFIRYPRKSIPTENNSLTRQMWSHCSIYFLSLTHDANPKNFTKQQVWENTSQHFSSVLSTLIYSVHLWVKVRRTGHSAQKKNQKLVKKEPSRKLPGHAHDQHCALSSWIFTSLQPQTPLLLLILPLLPFPEGLIRIR